VTRDERNRASTLERELGNVDAAEVRALANLRRAGHPFRTIAQAREWLAASRKVQAMTVDDVIANFIAGGSRHYQPSRNRSN
jgi:hypothetical protein